MSEHKEQTEKQKEAAAHNWATFLTAGVQANLVSIAPHPPIGLAVSLKKAVDEALHHLKTTKEGKDGQTKKCDC